MKGSSGSVPHQDQAEICQHDRYSKPPEDIADILTDAKNGSEERNNTGVEEKSWIVLIIDLQW